MVVIVSGLPGTGKSYFALRLSQRLGAEYISSDRTRKAMDAMGKYAFEDKLNVYEEMAKTAGGYLRQGKTVVVDATFYRHEMREIFRTLATLLHQPICYFEITAPEEVVKERLSVPRTDSEAGFAVYQQLKPQYESLPEEHLVLQSTNDNIDRMLSKAIDYIKRVNERVGS